MAYRGFFIEFVPRVVHLWQTTCKGRPTAIHKILTKEYLDEHPDETWRDANKVVPSDAMVSYILKKEGLKYDNRNAYAPVFRNKPSRVITEGIWVEYTPETNFREYSRLATK